MRSEKSKNKKIKPYFLYSESIKEVQKELDAAKKVFGEENTGTLITEVPENRLVIPRFRAIPFGKELEKEIQNRESILVNSYRQHRNIADIFNWYPELEELTASCYTVEDIPHLPEGEYFVKGETNSKKNDWFRSSYAPNKKELIRIMGNLQNDSLLGGQRLVIRPFQNFRKIGESVTGQPVFHERRAFVFKGKLLSDAYYWSSQLDFGIPKILVEEKYKKILKETIDRVSDLANFVVIDFAEYPDGSWAVVELNDGSMSGLSENDPVDVWKAFNKVVEEECE